MAAARVVVLSLLLLPLSGCIDVGPELDLSPCNAEVPRRLGPMDTLHVHDNRTYHLQLHDHGWRWAHLKIVPCDQATVVIAPPPKVRPHLAGPVFAYGYHANTSADNAFPLYQEWAVRAQDSNCQGTQAVGSSRFLAFAGPGLADPFYLVIAAETPYMSLELRTGNGGDSDAPTRIPLTLMAHDVLTGTKVKGQELSGIQTSMPPRNFRMLWNHAAQPSVASWIHVASWTEAAGVATATDYKDELILVVDGAKRTLGSSGTHTCPPGSVWRQTTAVEIPRPPAGEFQLERRYEQTSSEPRAASIGVTVITVPLEPPVSMSAPALTKSS